MMHAKKPGPGKRQPLLLRKKSGDEGLVVHDLTELKTQRGVKTLIATESRDAAIRECRRKVEKISRECRMDNVKYRDPHFDLYSNQAYCLHGLRQEAGQDDAVHCPATAKRVGDIYDHPHFIVDGIEAGDIKQGGAGDCWFLAAVATIANMPQLLESICVARDEKVGVYGFIFFRDGEWISEVIDDQLFVTEPDYADADDDMKRAFPTEEKYIKAVQSGSNALHFSKCADSNETWLPLLEKAFAKAHGDYTAIDGGFTGEGVEDLTGGVTSEIRCADIFDRDRFWSEELVRANKELLFAASISGLGAGAVNGIITSHAYSVLKTAEVGGRRFVQMRNPWGQSEWTGPWSDGSSEWTPEWLTALEHKFGDDGSFWMSYEDFLKTYTMINRTRVFTADWTVAQSWTQVNVGWPAQFSDQEFRIELSKSGPVVIVLQQADTRYFNGLEGQYEFLLDFRVRRDGESEYFARSKRAFGMSRSVNKELFLEAGTWIVSFRVARRPTGTKRRSAYINAFFDSQSTKFLQVARNYDYAFAKGLPVYEDVEEGEEEPEEEEQEEAVEEEQVQEEQQEEAPAEVDPADEDSLAVVGVRVHAMDPDLQVDVVVADEEEPELDPDDSCVTAFLHSAADRSGFLSFRMK